MNVNHAASDPTLTWKTIEVVLLNLTTEVKWIPNTSMIIQTLHCGPTIKIIVHISVWFLPVGRDVEMRISDSFHKQIS